MVAQNDLISIIIPMYNVEKSINKCVESILKSTYKNLEVILIDDGSSDGTLDVCMKIKENDVRVKVFSKDNSGAGLSREYGLNVAKGKYIGFVDSDDYIEMEMYEKLHDRVIKDNLEVCFCGNYIEYSNGKREENNIRFPKDTYEKEEIIKTIIRNSVWFPPLDSDANHMFSIWRGLYSVNTIKNNQIHFFSEREIGAEDGIFNFQILCNVERLGFIHECLYNYVINEESLSHNPSRWEPRYAMRSNNWYRYITEYSKQKKIDKYIVPYLNAEYLAKVRKSINELIYEEKENFSKLYKQEKEKFIFLKKIKILKTKGNGIRNKLDYILCFYFVKLYCFKLSRRK